MTGPEHFREAERLTEIARGQEPGLAAVDCQLAQVHATLALAAATAMDPSAGWRSASDPAAKEWAEVCTGGES